MSEFVDEWLSCMSQFVRILVFCVCLLRVYVVIISSAVRSMGLGCASASNKADAVVCLCMVVCEVVAVWFQKVTRSASFAWSEQ